MSRYDLKMKQAFGDFADWTYTGNCDAQGGYCECGKQIIYRYFVNKGEETKVVGSTCIDHFKGNSALYATLREADKENQRKHAEMKRKLKTRERHVQEVKIYLENITKGKINDFFESHARKFLDDPNQLEFREFKRIELWNKLERINIDK